jgi:hypothetical protein
MRVGGVVNEAAVNRAAVNGAVVNGATANSENVDLPEFVREALHAPAHLGADFTKSVAALAESLRAKLPVPLLHKRGSDYSVGDALSFELRASKPGASARSKGRLFEIMIFISSKAPLFAWQCFDRQQFFDESVFPHRWVPTAQLPSEIRDVLDGLQPFIEADGFREVPFECLQKPAPGCETELDGLPANVFQALFSELS